jgi:hypothetical protein
MIGIFESDGFVVFLQPSIQLIQSIHFSAQDMNTAGIFLILVDLLAQGCRFLVGLFDGFEQPDVFFLEVGASRYRGAYCV